MPTWILSLFKPVVGLITNRQNRKAAGEAAVSKLAAARQDLTAMESGQTHALELNKDEWEALQVKGMDATWKDEYVTLSIVSILNLIVVGGILTAFGQPELLKGVGIAMQSLTAAGVDIGFLMQAAVLAGLGLSIWKRF